MTSLDDLPLRDDLRGRSPYGAPQLDVPVRLNTNENPYPLPDALAAEVGAAAAAAAAALNRYPDQEAEQLRGDLAAYLGHELTAANVWAANGSNEVIQHLLLAFAGPGRTALGFEPSYSMHRQIAVTTGTSWVDARREEDFGIDEEYAVEVVASKRPDVCFLTSPNNPTGTALPISTVRRLLGIAPGMVVVDEAYAEFARSDTQSALTVLADHPRLVVTRTMSKAFALAGARLGYLAASPPVVDALHLVRLPYHLSALTQVAARVALRHRDELLGTVTAVKEERDRMLAELTRLGYEAVDSDTNFVLFGRFADQAAAWQQLLDRGVLIRDVGLPGWLRVSAGLPSETDAFLAALKEIT